MNQEFEILLFYPDASDSELCDSEEMSSACLPEVSEADVAPLKGVLELAIDQHSGMKSPLVPDFKKCLGELSF